MRTETRYLTEKVNRVAFGLWMLLVATGLCSCSYLPQSTVTPIKNLDFTTPQSGALTVAQGLDMSNFDTRDTNSTIKNIPKLGLTEDESKALGCGIGDRFERGATLAYNFKDEQNRLALNVGMSGPSFSDPTRIEFKNVILRFTHKFSKPIPNKRDKCRFKSGFQGLVGSTYNDFFVRTNFTVWKDLRNRLNLAQ